MKGIHCPYSMTPLHTASALILGNCRVLCWTKVFSWYLQQWKKMRHYIQWMMGYSSATSICPSNDIATCHIAPSYLRHQWCMWTLVYAQLWSKIQIKARNSKELFSLVLVSIEGISWHLHSIALRDWHWVCKEMRPFILRNAKYD